MTFRCSECGAVLFEDNSPKFSDSKCHTQDYLSTVRETIGASCPNCGHVLPGKPISVKVSSQPTVYLREVNTLQTVSP